MRPKSFVFKTFIANIFNRNKNMGLDKGHVKSIGRVVPSNSRLSELM